MDDNTGRRPGGRSQLLLVAAVFIGPLLVAAWLYYGSSLRPAGGSNAGALLEPIVNVADEVPDSTLPARTEGQWVLLYADAGPCEQACRDALYRSRQSRLMLGKEMDRVLRVFLHGESLPDTVVAEVRQDGLITLSDKGLAALLERKRPGSLASGGLYLLDPLGNLVMYFPPDLDPKEMVGDIKHLLRLSHIG